MTKLQLQNLDQTVVDPFLNVNISNTNNIKKFWVGIFKGQGHISQVYYTAVTDIHLAHTKGAPGEMLLINVCIIFYLRLFFWKKWDDLEDLELRLYLSLYFKIFSKIIF